MKRKIASVFSVVAIFIASIGYVMAEGDMTEQKPMEIKVQLGDSSNAMRFYPANLEFETGKLYKLVLHNSSGTKHYFSSEGIVALRIYAQSPGAWT